MTSLFPPWPGLAAVSPYVDVWSLVDRLGLDRLRRCARQPDAPGVPSFTELRDAGLSAPASLRVVGTPAWRTEAPGVRFLVPGDPDWPERLVGVPKGPVALSALGDVGLLRRPTVAIVGSRSCTAYGREWAARLANAVVESGGVVVSGLAAGIDHAAHTAAGGATVAVLGQGLEAVMPAWQRRARDSLLAKGGLVLSELPPDTHANRYTFPPRNRIIAGLARVVVVVEAGERSGALITASRAIDIGRELLVVPGPLGASASAGCLALLEEGAAGVVRGPESVLRDAGLLAPGGRARDEPAAVDAAMGTTARIYAALVGALRTPEELAAATGLAWPVVMEGLGVLELTGRAIRLPGRRYQARTA